VLVSGSERRPIPSLPIKIDISTDKSYTLEATKKGFQTFTQPIRFEDGEAEKTFVIDLQSESAEPPVAAAAPAAAPAAPAGGRATPASASKAAALAGIDPGATAAAKPAPAAAAGGGKLNVNSIPVSKVIVDGVPRGQTPQIGLSVPAGPHTVVFIHPEHGRKTSTVNVEAGKTATAVVKFP
jgi:serine/threonine-protein kinase